MHVDDALPIIRRSIVEFLTSSIACPMALDYGTRSAGSIEEISRSSHSLGKSFREALCIFIGFWVRSDLIDPTLRHLFGCVNLCDGIEQLDRFRFVQRSVELSQ